MDVTNPLDYFQRKLNEMPKEDKPNNISQNGHIGQAVNADLKEPNKAPFYERFGRVAQYG
jgi:hypothetical protein